MTENNKLRKAKESKINSVKIALENGCRDKRFMYFYDEYQNGFIKIGYQTLFHKMRNASKHFILLQVFL